MPNYTVRLKHDNGIIRVRTFAKDRNTAIDLVVVAEGCPRSAVLSANVEGNKWLNPRRTPLKSKIEGFNN